MSFIHPQSCECTKSELELFSVPLTQTAIESGAWIEYCPIASIGEGGPIEFMIAGNGIEYIDCCNSQIMVKAQITNNDGTLIDATRHVAPVNLFLHSLFSEVEVKLNDVLVSATNNTYPYRAYIETLLSYSPSAKASQLTAALYYKDVSGAAFDESHPQDANGLNTGLKKRYGFIEAGRTVDMVGRLHSDIFLQQKYIPSDVGMKVRLMRSKNAFCLMSDTQAAAYKVKILECKLLIRKVKVNPSVYIGHAKALEISNAKYPIRRVIVKSYTIGTGSLDNTQEALFTGLLPARIIIGCVDNDAFNGSWRKSPFNFQNYDLRSIKIFLDGQSQSYIRPIELNYGEHQHVAGYASLFTGTNTLGRDSGLDISRDDYADGYCIYAFDLSPDLSEESYFNLAREGNLRVELKFGTALPRTLNVVVYAEFESLLEIDRNKHIITDFAN
jgi:hypothetical protein